MGVSERIWKSTSWLSNHMPSKALDGITYPFPSFSGCAVEVWEGIRNFIWHFIMDVIINPCWDWSQSMLVKVAPGMKVTIQPRNVPWNSEKISLMNVTREITEPGITKSESPAAVYPSLAIFCTQDTCVAMFMALFSNSDIRCGDLVFDSYWDFVITREYVNSLDDVNFCAIQFIPEVLVPGMYLSWWHYVIDRFLWLHVLCYISRAPFINRY